MIFHFALNAFFIFLALSVCIECAFVFIKIQNRRIRYCARLLPLIKLPFDAVLFTFFDQGFFINLNPFSCEMYFSDFLATLLPAEWFFSLAPSGHLVIPTYLAALLPPLLLKSTMLLILLTACSLLCFRIYQFIQYKKYFMRILHNASVYQKTLYNQSLQAEINRFQAIVLISSDVTVPLSAESRYIIFPHYLLSELSQEEFEAVIAHELEHLRWRDPLLKLFSVVIASLFWWIPTRWWIKRLECDQEQASDCSVHRYGLRSIDLAQALLKVVGKIKTNPHHLSAMCPLVSKKNMHVERFHKLLHGSVKEKSTLLFFKYFIFVHTLAFLFLSLWMC